LNFYKNQELLRKAREVKTIADMPKFVTLLHQAHLQVTEEDSEDVLRSLEGCLDRGELLQRLTTLGGTKTMNGALLVLPQFSQGHNILLWLFFHAGMMVKMLVFKHGCTSGISLWVRHAENHEYSKRIVNCLPVMHIMATIIRKCIQLQSGLAKLDEEFASTEDIRAKIVALCKHDLSEVSSSSRSVLTSEAKLRSIVVLSDAVFKGLKDRLFKLLLQLLQFLQQAVYTPVDDSTDVTRLFIHAGTFALRVLYHMLDKKLQRLKELKKRSVKDLRPLVQLHRRDLPAAEVRGMKKSALMRALLNVPSLVLAPAGKGGDSGKPPWALLFGSPDGSLKSLTRGGIDGIDDDDNDTDDNDDDSTVAGLHEHCFGEHLADQAEVVGSNFPFIVFEEMGEQGHHFDAKWDQNRFSGHNDHMLENRRIATVAGKQKASSNHAQSTMRRKPLPALHFLRCTHGENLTRLLGKIEAKQRYQGLFTREPEVVFKGESADVLKICFCGECPMFATPQ